MKKCRSLVNWAHNLLLGLTSLDDDSVAIVDTPGAVRFVELVARGLYPGVVSGDRGALDEPVSSALEPPGGTNGAFELNIVEFVGGSLAGESSRSKTAHNILSINPTDANINEQKVPTANTIHVAGLFDAVTPSCEPKSETLKATYNVPAKATNARSLKMTA